jgi:hypothetical protein
MAELPKANKPAADHLTDFKTPIYNIWKQQTRVATVCGNGFSDDR